MTIQQKKAEICRRWKYRNVGGFFGLNSRVWIRSLIADIREMAPTSAESDLVSYAWSESEQRLTLSRPDRFDLV